MFKEFFRRNKVEEPKEEQPEPAAAKPERKVETKVNVLEQFDQEVNDWLKEMEESQGYSGWAVWVGSAERNWPTNFKISVVECLKKLPGFKAAADLFRSIAKDGEDPEKRVDRALGDYSELAMLSFSKYKRKHEKRKYYIG